MSPRDLVRRFMEGAPTDRVPVVMHLGAYAARLQHARLQELAGDATLFANSLQSAQKLLWLRRSHRGGGSDGGGRSLRVHGGLAGRRARSDLASLGGRGRCGRRRGRREAVRRDPACGRGGTGASGGGLGGHPPPECGHRQRGGADPGGDRSGHVGPLLRGPEFLADLESAPERAYQAAEAALAVTVQVAKQYLDLGLDHLVVFDPLLGSLDPIHYARLGSGLRILWNVADFYDVRVLLHTRVDDDARVAALRALAPGGLIVYGERGLGGGGGG